MAPKGKRITPCPEKMLGVVTPYHSRSHSLEAQREWIGSLVSGSSVQTQRVLWVRGWGNQPSVFPFPLPGLILSFCTLIMRGWWGLSFLLLVGKAGREVWDWTGVWVDAQWPQDHGATPPHNRPFGGLWATLGGRMVLTWLPMLHVPPSPPHDDPSPVPGCPRSAPNMGPHRQVRTWPWSGWHGYAGMGGRGNPNRWTSK